MASDRLVCREGVTGSTNRTTNPDARKLLVADRGLGGLRHHRPPRGKRDRDGDADHRIGRVRPEGSLIGVTCDNDDVSAADDQLLVLPDDLRHELRREPMGPIETDADRLLETVDGPLIAVGDVVTYHLLEGPPPDVASWTAGPSAARSTRSARRSPRREHRGAEPARRTSVPVVRALRARSRPTTRPRYWSTARRIWSRCQPSSPRAGAASCDQPVQEWSRASHRRPPHRHARPALSASGRHRALGSCSRGNRRLAVRFPIVSSSRVASRPSLPLRSRGGRCDPRLTRRSRHGHGGG